MTYNKSMLSIALVFSEVCFQALLYLLIIGLMKVNPLINPWHFFILGAAFTTVNFFLSRGHYQRLTIGIVNGFLLALGAGLTTGQMDFILFSPPADTQNIVNYVLVYLLILWLWYRSLTLVFRSKIDIYAHFDWNICLTFFVFLLADLTQIALPGGMAWLVASIFFNVLTLFIFNNTGEKRRLFSWLVLALAFFTILGLSVKTSHLFPHLTGTAGILADLISSVLLFAARIFALIIYFFLKNTNQIPNSATPNETPRGPALDLKYVAHNSPWLESILTGLGWILAIISIGLLLLILLYFIRLLIIWLLQRQKGTYEDLPLCPVHFWRKLSLLLFKRLKMLWHLILLFFPITLPVYLSYRYLLRWGAWKKCPRQIHETPDEYYERLVQSYPAHRQELKLITDIYVCCRYSDNSLPSLAPRNLISSLRKLYLPPWFSFSKNDS